MSRIWNDIKYQFNFGGPETKLIFINVGIFVVSALTFAFAPWLGFPDWLMLRPGTVLYYPWTLVTYAFLHGGFFHLVGNMLVLNFSARLFRTYFSARQMVGVYFLGAVFAGLVFVASYYLLGRANGLVGSSAAVMAVLVAITTYNPVMEVRLLLIGNVKLWIITGVLIFLDLISISVENTGGHISHLSAAAFGFIYMKTLESGTDMSNLVSAIADFFVNLSKPGSKQPKFKKVHRNYDKKTTQKATSVVQKDRTQQQIDEILDKISRSGYDSLTKDEKDFLFRAGK